MAAARQNLAALGEDAFERNGDYDSILFEGRWYSSAEVFDLSRRLGRGFVRLGIKPGDRVVVLMSNAPEVGAVYQGLWRAGAAVTPVIFLVSAKELGRILRDSGATALVTSPEFLPTAREAAEGAPAVAWLVLAEAGAAMPGGAAGEAQAPAADEAARGGERLPVVSLRDLGAGGVGGIVPRDDGDLAALIYTGGTTGQAKGVMLSHANLYLCGEAAMSSSFVPGVTRAISALPLSHAFGLITTIVGLHSPEPIRGVLMRWFDPMAWLELVQEHRVHRAAVVPSMLQILLGAPLEAFELSSLRYVNCGAVPLAIEVAREFERRVPSAQILEGYGCTESGAVISVNRPGARKLGSVGPPIPGYQVRVIDEEGGALPPGEVGEICCRSPGVMVGYWNEPDLTEATIRNGWLRTGDMGRVDQDGFLWIVDRKKDLIIRGGFNVFPRDVEDVLLEHPAVAMAGVVGRPDERQGEEVVAFVSLRAGQHASPDELIAFCRERLAAHTYPREVRVVPVVPLTPVGKVDRKALRSML